MSVDDFDKANNAILEELRGTSLVLHDPARVVSKVANLPLATEIACEQFTLTPIEGASDPHEHSLTGTHELRPTVTSTYAVPDDEPRNWPAARHKFLSRLETMRLLLSFTQRRHVAIYDCALEIQRNGEWQRQGVHIPDRVLATNTQGHPWTPNDHVVQNFLAAAYSRLLDETIPEHHGLRLALSLLDQSFGQRIGESEYLLAWMAIEVLVQRSQFGPRNRPSGLLEANLFDTIKRRLLSSLDDALTDLIEGGKLEAEVTKSARSSYGTKFGKLNEVSIATSAVEFANALLGPFGEPTIVKKQIQPLVTLRDQIVHTGVLDEQSYPDYANTMRFRLGQVIELVQRLILALLDVHPFHLGGTWQNQYERFEQYLAETLTRGYEPPIPIKDFRKAGGVLWQPPSKGG